MTYPYRELHWKVARSAQAEGMEVLDLTSAFAAEGEDWSQWWVTPYDRHPNPAAHLVAARAIAVHLTKHGWATRSGAPLRDGADSATGPSDSWPRGM